MPFDIALGSNTPTGTLEFRSAQPLPGNAGFAALLVVRAGSFAAALPFFATSDAVRAFAEGIGAMTTDDVAPARLSAREGGNFVNVARDADSVTVSGELSEDDDEQALRFRFVTRASGLASLHGGLCRLLDG